MAGETVLVVEDSPTEMSLILNTLGGSGFRLVTATNGEEAISKVGSERPSLVLLDVVLPGKNGFQVCRELKMSPENRHLKVILLTSKNQESDRFWGLKQGADDYVVKPFEGGALLATMKRQLGL
ncbi:MAG TPA: response regulator [Thermoanaerobaculia bacterium]|nr:response regulator [Thermoanaerobaculia bacterium]